MPTKSVLIQQHKNLLEYHDELKFAFENLRRIYFGEGGTARIGEDGFPLRCESCGEMIFYGHGCGGGHDG